MDKRELDTPYVLIDLDLAERNIQSMQATANAGGIGLRPHAKTHKMPEVARMQLDAGAVGITVAKLGEAQVMAEAGIPDILIAYPIIGKQKVERLASLLPKARFTTIVESREGVAAAAEAARIAGRPLNVLIEIDSGFHRVGVQPGEPVLELAKEIAKHELLQLKGILTFAGQSYDNEDEEVIKRVAAHEATIAAETAGLLRQHGFPVEIVSVGSTPASRFSPSFSGITDIRPGTYVLGDLMQVKLGALPLENCALTVQVTVVSRPAPDRAVVDAGTKVFTSDGEDSPIGTGRGYVVGHPGITLEWLTEEHGMLGLAPEEQGLAIGDRLEIVPVHCCAVVNMFDEVAAVRKGQVEAIWQVGARGKVR